VLLSEEAIEPSGRVRHRLSDPFEAYPSILDPDSELMSFDTVGQTAYLYFSRINGYDPLDFDLLRIPIRFERSI
jgi:hypothetical protein